MGTPGSPPTRLTAVPDKWARPTRRLADLLVDLPDVTCRPEDSLVCKIRKSKRIKAAQISFLRCY
jgi:hypothetical protein